MPLSAKQLADRLTFIGGSDSGAVAGVNPYRSPKDVWLEKTGQAAPFEGNEATYWGNKMEKIIREAIYERTGSKVFTEKKAFRHEVIPFIGCHLDGWRWKNGEKCVIEIKNVRYKPKDMDNHYYMVQLQHNMLATGFRCGELWVLFSGCELVCFERDRDGALMLDLLAIYQRFWPRVEARTWPEEEAA